MAIPPMLRRPLEAMNFLAPIREASPEEDSAPPSLDMMVSRAEGASWIPDGWLKALATNDDPMIARDGSGLKVYDALLSDETAMSTLQQRRLAITSKDWEVAPGDDKDPRSVKAADDFRAMLSALGFDHVTGMIHYAVWYGYAVAEGLFSIKQHDGRLIVWLDDIVVPDRRHFGFTHEGELRRVQDAVNAIGGEDLPPNKFLTVRTGGTHDFAFYGLGLAHWCYWPIFFKRAALKFWALYLEKYGQPTVVVEFTEAEKDDTAKRANLLAAAVAIGKDSAVLVPEGTIKNERLKVMEPTRPPSGVSGYKDFVTEQNEAIMRVVLGQPGTSKGVSSGLNSDQASEHGEVKAEIVKADSDLISEGFNRTFARWLTTWNHGPDVAPPLCRRVLDGGETLDARAKRDVQLDGIGIVLDDQGIQEIYGDRYSRKEPDPVPAALPVPGAGGGAAQLDAAKRAKVAEFAAQGGDKPFSPLYVSRKLLNAAEVVAWAKRQGFKVTVPADEMHVTVLYSKTAVDWFDMAGEGWDGAEVTVDKGGARFVERFGDDNSAIVLRFYSPMIRYRHDSMIERGASHSFDRYDMHVTISHDGADVDLAQVEPFVGELRFGPEIFEPIKTEPAGDQFLAFTAADEEAIERLIASLCEEADPVFEAMGAEIRGSLQGVTTVEGAKIAMLSAMERLPIDRLARLTALPMLAERAAGSVGADDEVKAR